MFASCEPRLRRTLAQVTRAAPRFALASAVTDVTLWGENFPSPTAAVFQTPFAVFTSPGTATSGGRTAGGGWAVVRVVAEDGELISVERAEFREGALYLTVGRLALTGPVHFEVKFRYRAACAKASRICVLRMNLFLLLNLRVAFGRVVCSFCPLSRWAGERQ